MSSGVGNHAAVNLVLVTASVPAACARSSASANLAASSNRPFCTYATSSAVGLAPRRAMPPLVPSAPRPRVNLRTSHWGNRSDAFAPAASAARAAASDGAKFRSGVQCLSKNARNADQAAAGETSAAADAIASPPRTPPALASDAVADRGMGSSDAATASPSAAAAAPAAAPRARSIAYSRFDPSPLRTSPIDVCASAARAARVAAITVTSSFNASPSHHEHASFVALWNSPCAHSCATVPGIDDSSELPSDSDTSAPATQSSSRDATSAYSRSSRDKDVVSGGGATRRRRLGCGGARRPRTPPSDFSMDSFGFSFSSRDPSPSSSPASPSMVSSRSFRSHDRHSSVTNRAPGGHRRNALIAASKAPACASNASARRALASPPVPPRVPP